MLHAGVRRDEWGTHAQQRRGSSDEWRFTEVTVVEVADVSKRLEAVFEIDTYPDARGSRNIWGQDWHLFQLH